MDTEDKIVAGIIAGNEKITAYFFGDEVCGKIFKRINYHHFHNRLEIEKNEFISGFYVHLQENEWQKLRKFEGKSEWITYIWTIAHRFLVETVKKERKRKSAEVLIADDEDKGRAAEDILSELASEREEEKDYEKQKKESMEKLWDSVENELEKLNNKRYRFVLQELLKGREPQEIADQMEIEIDNLYNIKSRALKRLAKIYKKEVENAKLGKEIVQKK
ncbi:MAG: hypothetical protein FWH36_05825, partial [Lentimicrobiaceae bacterium]|nr:hypothetical protein [Lentimicrobiaceae bacterium]